MSGNWHEKKWGDLITLEYGKSLKGYKEGDGEYRVFGTNGPIGWTDKYLTEGPSIIIGRKGAYRGVEYSSNPFYVIDTAFYVNPKVDFNMLWAYYQMLTIDIDGMDSGSAIPSTSRDEFYQLTVQVPPIGVQKEIANRLNTIDQKIHLNQQINETLEEMAQVIFKSWFVDFDPVRAKIEAASAGRDPNRAAMAVIAGISLEMDWDEIAAALDQKLARMSEAQQQQLTRTAELFPDKLVESEIGVVPNGWGYDSIESKFKCVLGGTPSRRKKKYWNNGTIPWINSGSVNKLRVIEPDELITEKALSTSSAKLMPKRTTLIAITGATLGQVSLLEIEASANQSVVGVYDENFRINEWLNLSIKESISDLKRYAGGGAQQHINKGIVEDFIMLFPPDEIIERFNQYILPLFNQIGSNLMMSKQLEQIRDTLLPKLISGEVKL